MGKQGSKDLSAIPLMAWGELSEGSLNDGDRLIEVAGRRSPNRWNRERAWVCSNEKVARRYLNVTTHAFQTVTDGLECCGI